MLLQSYYQQEITKTCKNVLVKDLKDWDIGMNIKQKAKTKARQASINIFLNVTW